jgi:hypothetical protein
MRLRVEITPPLAPTKAWITVNGGFFGFGTHTIADLREQIISQFELPDSVELLLDDFKLPEKEAIHGLLKEGELIKYGSV